MEYVVICSAALLASALTLFSGFGLGTLLLPTFALFFPLTAAVAMTAVVHLLNNLFKLALLARLADRGVVLRFGLPGIVAAVGGALLLVRLSDMAPVITHNLFGSEMEITPLRLVLAGLMILFALFEVVPRFRNFAFEQRHLITGGLLSGFFGGLSGHQGALRSAFLLKCGLKKETFIATGVAIACIVDVTRIAVYGVEYSAVIEAGNSGILIAAVLAAFLGAYVGRRLMKKVSMSVVRWLVAVMLMGIALGLGLGAI